MSVNMLQGGEFIRGGDFLPELPVGGVQSDLPTQSKGEPVPHFYLKDRAIETPTGLVYQAVEMIDIFIPGDIRSLATHKVTEVHRRRFARHYEAFKKGQEVAQVGTPLEFWGGMNSAQIRTLKAHGVFTVENLAGLSDTSIQNIGGMLRAVVARAKAYIEYQNSGAKLVQDQAAKIAALEDRNALQSQQMQQMIAQMENQGQQMKLLTAGVQVGAFATTYTAPPAAPLANVEGAFGPVGGDAVTDRGTLDPAEPIPQPEPGILNIPMGTGLPKRGPGRPPNLRS